MALTRIQSLDVVDSDFKSSVRAATTGDVTLVGGAPNTVDGYSVSLYDRILVKSQVDPTQNGIYYVAVVGTGSNGTWKRAADFSSTSNVSVGAETFVESGSTYANSWFIIPGGTGAISIGTTAIRFANVGDFLSFRGGVVNNAVTIANNFVVTGQSNVNTLFANTIAAATIGNSTSLQLGTLGTNAQPYVTSVGTLTSLTVSGAANLSTVFATSLAAGTIGNTSTQIYAGNITTTNGVYWTNGASFSSTITGTYSNANVANYLPTYSGNVNAAYLLSTGLITSGNISNVSYLNTTNAVVSNAVLGNTATFANVAAATLGNAGANITGTITTNAQPYITSLGMLSSLNATGNIVTTAGNLQVGTGQGGMLVRTLVGGTAFAVYNMNTVPSQFNYALTYDGGSLTLNSPTGGGIYTSINNSALTKVQAGTGSSSATGGQSLIIYSGGLGVTGDSYVSGNVGASGSLTVAGATNLNTLTASGAANLSTVYATSIAAGTIGNSSTILFGNVIYTTGSGFIGKDLYVTGNLFLEGNTTVVNTANVITNDKTLTLGNAFSTSAALDGSGLLVGNVAVATWLYSDASTSWQSNKAITPQANAAYNLGSPLLYWNNVYAANLGVGTIATLGTSTANSYTTNYGGQITGYHTGAIGANAANSGAFTTITATGAANLATIYATSIAAGTIGNTSSIIYGNVTAGNLVTTAGVYWANGVSIGSYSNATVAAYLPTYAGTVNAASVITASLTVTGASIANSYTAQYGGQITGYHTGAIGANTPNSAAFTTITASGAANLTTLAASTISATTVGNSNTSTVFIGTLATNAQPYVTSVGTLTSLVASGAANLATVYATAIAAATIGNSSTALIGTLSTNAQPYITSLGTQTSLAVSGAANLTTVAASTISALTVGNSNTSTIFIGTLATNAQPYVTSIGTLSSLAVSGAANLTTAAVNTLSATVVGNSNTSTTFIGTLATNAQPYVTAVGTLTALVVNGTTNLGTTTASTLSAGTIGNSGATLTGTLSTAAQTNITSLGTLTGLTVNGTSTLGAVTASTVSAGTLGNSGATLTGTLSTAAQTNITSVGTLTSLSVSGGVTLSGGSSNPLNLSANDTWASMRVIRNTNTTGGAADGMYIGYGNGNSGITRFFGGGGTSNFVAFDNSSFYPNGDNSLNLGGGSNRYATVYGVTFSGTSTTAKYADLAERYAADCALSLGQIVVFGGDQDITLSSRDHDEAVAGIVSDKPAFLMNEEESGPAIALQGKVACWVWGPIRKGQGVVSSGKPGIGRALDRDLYTPGCGVGKAMQSIDDDSIQLIMVSVGRF
jgi:hypothetical protein